MTPYHAAATAAAWLDAAGFTRLEEADYWNLEPGKGYYLLRNGSAVVAWRIPRPCHRRVAHHRQPQRRPGLEDQVRRRDE